MENPPVTWPGYDIHRASHGFSMALIEIDGLASYKTGGFSMANCECHNQRVNDDVLLESTTRSMPPGIHHLANWTFWTSIGGRIPTDDSTHMTGWWFQNVSNMFYFP